MENYRHTSYEERLRLLFSLACILLLGSGYGAKAQYIRLNGNDATSALYFNLNRLFNYNLYEHARFGAELYWVNPNANTVPQWQISVYGAYGTYDRRMKYGFTVARQYVGRRRWRPYVHFADDLAQMSSVRLDPYALLTPFVNTGFVASHFARVREGEIGASAQFKKVQVAGSLRYVREWLLYDAYGNLLYPALFPDEEPSFCDYGEARLRFDWKSWTLDLRAGIDGEEMLHPGRHEGNSSLFFRTILQYSNTFTTKHKGKLRVFGQSGIASSQTHYQHLFDLSGTYGSYYYFQNTLLTLPSNSFVTDRYSRFSVTYTPDFYFWSIPQSHPQPFVQIGGAIGRNLRDGSKTLAVIEPAVGIEGIVRWGYLDIGVAAAYRFSTDEASIPQPTNLGWLSHPFAVMAVAKLILQ